MIDIANQLVQVLFKKNSLEDCTRWELEILADKYPYFGIAQLLVSGKLKEENKEAYEKQVQKTSLYFTNPLWLDYVLNKKSGDVAKHTEKKEAGVIIPEAAAVEEIQTTISEPEPIVDQPGLEVPVDVSTEPQIQLEEKPSSELQTEASSIPEDAKPVIEAPEEIFSHPVADIMPRLAEEQDEVSSSPEPNEVGLKIPGLKTEPLNLNAPFVFEPYHTVDYFASQGIKLKVDEKPQDKFGQQLKSFTQWLKTLKKAPAEETSKDAGKTVDPKVAILAEHSLEDRDVVTEPMADVWLKQGNKQKAIEIYEKLSLQNPDKSAYFAGLIEQLKQH